MAPASSRRITYVVPSPSGTVPRLRLPPEGTSRNGQTGPILLPAENSSSNGVTFGKKSRHPRHRLAVAAFALDTSTQLVGRDSPEGILYSGGRDGMIMAWDLGMPMKHRSPRFGSSPSSPYDSSRRMGRWERLTIDEDDDNAIYEEEDDDWPASDGDVIGDVLGSSGRRGSRYWMRQGDLPYEQRWELDVNLVEPRQPAYWRKHVQAHTDWVNDLLLCNLNQTVISGSSDGTVKAWNPNSSKSSSPSTIGTHSDYVRCLTQCQDRKWVASGSFDRTIKLWDLSQPRTDPLVTLSAPETAGPKSSVYALATDPFGHVVAAGGPERVIRTWDPRSGKRTGKLVGHTDNIRAILMSEDSRYLLTGSADASIKLWSLRSPQRCIYTFTHHTESVWSLFSTHPALETFYSGDRSGVVCRVDVEECQRVAQGECIALCKDTGEPTMASSEGVSKIVAMSDHLVWTASGSSSIRRWRVPQGRIARAMANSPIDERHSPARSLHRHTSISNNPRVSSSPPEGQSLRQLRGESLTPSITASLASHESSLEFETEENSLNGIPYESLIKLSAPNVHHGTFGITPMSRNGGREAEVSTIYSAASAKSVPHKQRPSSGGALSGHAYGHSQGHMSVSTSGRRDTLSPPIQESAMSGAIPLPSPRQAYEDRDVAPDAIPLVAQPDLVIEGEHGLVRVLIMNNRVHALTVDTAGVVAVWDIVRCQCLGVFSKEDVCKAVGRSDTARPATGASTTASVANSPTGTANNGDTVASTLKSSSPSSTPGSDNGCENNKISPRQALEVVRDRIEGEAVVNPWCNADTRIGGLAIHILDRCFESEIFADEVGYSSHSVEHGSTGRAYGDDQRLNIGKWVLRNLFAGFIREEQRLAAKVVHDKHMPSAYPYRGTHAHGHGLAHNQRGHNHPRASSESAVGDRTPSPLNTSDLPPVPALPADLAPTGAWTSTKPQGLSPIAQSPEGSGNDALLTPRPGNHAKVNLAASASSGTGEDAAASSNDGATAATASAEPTPRPVTATPSTSSASHDYFSIRRRPSTSHSTSTMQTTTATTAPEEDFSGWAGPSSSKSSSTAHDTIPSAPSTPGGGFMGRLKSFNIGKSTRRSATEVETPSAATTQVPAEANESKVVEPARSPSPPKTLIEQLKSQPVTPLSSQEAPPLHLPNDTAIIISEELASGWTPVYRGTVATVGADAHILEELLPDWLLEFLLTSKAPSVPVVKLSFVLLPLPIPEEMRDIYGETLPDLLNTQHSKLSASRFLRARKLCIHVQDKLDKNLQSKPSSPRSSSDAISAGRVSLSMTSPSSEGPPGSTSSSIHASSSASTSRASTPRLYPNMQLHGTNLPQTQLPRAEDAYEILCNDQVLSNDMTLAAVRQFIWRQSGELVMYYRRKAHSLPPTTSSISSGRGTGSSTSRSGTPRLSTEHDDANDGEA